MSILTHAVTAENGRDDDHEPGSSPRTRREAPPKVRKVRTRPWWTPGPIVGVVLVAVLATLGLVAGSVVSSHTPKLYSSTTVVRVYNPYRLSGSSFGQVDPVTVVNLERQYADSKALQTVVDAQLVRRNIAHARVEWSSQPDAATITVRCFAKLAAASSSCAQQYADTYVATRSKVIARPLNLQYAALGASLARLNQGIDALQARVSAASTVSGSDRNRGLLAEQATLLKQVEQLTGTRQEVKAQADILAGNYQIVTPARTPTALTTPYTLRNRAAGIGVGFLLGLALYLALSSAGVRRTRATA
jgi:hypothetical protein